VAPNFNLNIVIREGKIVLLIAEESGSVAFRLVLSSTNAAHLSHELDRANHSILNGMGDQYVCQPNSAVRKERH
jgi:hypothetical protein